MGKREHIYEIIAENIRKERRRLGIMCITQCHLARCSRKCSICNCFFSKVPKKLFMRQSSKKRVYEINGLKE